MRRIIASLLPLLALFSCAFVGCGPAQVESGGDGSTLAAPTESPKVFGSVGEFEFTERRAETVTRESLLGKPWLAGFIFTRCSTICPAMTQELARANKALEPVGARVVALSVDPEHDTPEVLSEYASHFDTGESENWLFLRGDEQTTYEFIKTSFKLAVERLEDEDPGLAVSHSSLLVAVDAEGQIRGYYNGIDQARTDEAIRRMRFLAGAPRTTSILPTINAGLNATTTLLLLLAFLAIKRDQKERHGRLMKTAFLTSAAFLSSYLYYHFVVLPASGGPVRFAGEGPAKVAYLILLLTHVLGAMINLPMVLRTFWLAHKERWDSHKKWAKWTFPLWLYVSVTGVMVYFALYVM